MTIVTNIAQRILDENNKTVSDITLVNMEYLVKNAVDHINSQTGRSISFTPAAGAASLTANDDEIPVIKNLSALLLRSYLEKDPNIAFGGMSVSAIANDTQYTLFMQLVNDGLMRLRGRSFEVT
jgi:hypothetical protein